MRVIRSALYCIERCRALLAEFEREVYRRSGDGAGDGLPGEIAAPAAALRPAGRADARDAGEETGR